jgi:predicted ATP-grasp superfamily ATP-dependent carboligase
MAAVGHAVAARRHAAAGSEPPLALVMGDVDLVRALGLARIPVAFFGPPDASARFSRHVRSVLPWIDHWARQDELVAALLRFGRRQRRPPVLFPQTDAALLLASRHRAALASAFRLMLADAELVEQLVDKARFAALARRHGLPVPAAERVRPRPGEPPPALGVAFPVVVKPVVRAADWAAVSDGGKALHVGGADEWSAIWPRLTRLRSDIVVQELVPGPETAVESYHAYIDERGTTAGEFTGRKVRTFPPRYGYSTAVEVTELPDVAELGREVLAAVGLRGVAKLDFKRDESGRLHLLEINPRFSLWHHPAAMAGVNVPALVHADLTGRPRPPGRRAAGRVAWCMPLADLRTAHAGGMPALSWLRWARGCKAMSGLSREDPLPFLRATLPSAVSRRMRRGAP